MIQEERFFTSYDGLEIYYQSWSPDNKPRAIIQLIHGFAEHSSRYVNVVNALVPQGFTIYANDHRGHGKSKGFRGYANSFNDYVMDERKFTEIIKKHEDDIPIFLLGHSIGSYIAIYYCSETDSDFTGVILSGSGTQVGGKVNPLLIFMNRFLSKILPRGKLSSNLSDDISRDQAVVEAYKNDPYIFKFVTFRLGKEILETTKRIPSQIAKITIPVLFQSGSQDKIILGAEERFNHITTKDKTLKIYPGLFHEVYNELEDDRKQVLHDLADWLIKHTSG